MKVYFTASIVGKKNFLPNYRKIVGYLTDRGYSVQASHILDTTEKQIQLKTKEERLHFHSQLEQWIQNADFIVVEASFPSISVGYEISLALKYRKPVLILYSEGDPPSLFGYYHDDKLVCEKYTLGTVTDLIDEFIAYAGGAADTRFTFFITPQIAAFLENVSVKHKIPKSVYLRRLIEDHMSRTS